MYNSIQFISVADGGDGDNNDNANPEMLKLSIKWSKLNFQKFVVCFVNFIVFMHEWKVLLILNPNSNFSLRRSDFQRCVKL